MYAGLQTLIAGMISAIPGKNVQQTIQAVHLLFQTPKEHAPTAAKWEPAIAAMQTAIIIKVTDAKLH